MLRAHEIELQAQQLYEAYQNCSVMSGFNICIPSLRWNQEPEFYKDIWRRFVPRAKAIVARESPSEN